MAEAAPRLPSFSPLPEFGEVAHRREVCSPAELFSSLFIDLEEHVHYLEPAFTFAVTAVCRAALPELRVSEPLEMLEALIEWASGSLSQGPLPEDAVRVARELAPLGLSDGAWLRGFSLANAVETETSMLLLKQLMLRFGDPASHESYAERYASLLRSLGILPAAVLHGEREAAPPCTALAYEHALLGLCLGLFPTTLGLEALGFNLWMATLGPCPLLARLERPLRARGACWRYFEQHDGPAMARLARQAVQEALRAPALPETLPSNAAELRIARGFVAAHESYRRWERALSGPASGLGTSQPVELAGEYAPPQDPDALEEFALSRYGELSPTELYYCFANSDCHPASHVYARVFVSEIFAQLNQALDTDARLNSQHPPAYSERGVAEMVAAQHAKNVASRPVPEPPGQSRPEALNDASPSAAENEDNPSIIQVFDGSWLQGFADVQRAGFEEYGWLFRIYASEHGDGDWAYNHCQIFRRAFAQLGPDVMLPKTDRRLYDLFEIGVAAVATLAVSLNTRRFMPEILGINLGIEATGVGGSYMDQWKSARGPGANWRVLAWRLHNSIDNYADGHTKWSLAAVQSFMRRVKDAAPSETEAQWRKIWRLWRCQDILTHGSDSEREALGEYLSLSSLAPTPV